jgi:malonate transporter
VIELITIVAPVFAVVAVGFFVRRAGLVGDRGTKRVVLFVFNAAIPVMLFRTMLGTNFPAEIQWGFLLAFYGAAFLTYGAGLGVAHYGFKRPRAELAIYGMGAGFSNTVMLGIPLLLGAFGEEATVPVFLIIAFHSITLLPVSVLLIQTGRGQSERSLAGLWQLLLDVLTNPIILGLTLGLIANYFDVTLPGLIDSAIAPLAAIAIPCALIALGLSLGGYPLSGDLKPALSMAALKLAVHPTLAWIIAVPVLGLGTPWAQVAVVMASMPSGAMVYLFGARYDAAPDVAARTVLIASAMSVVTVSVWMVLMGA